MLLQFGHQGNRKHVALEMTGPMTQWKWFGRVCTFWRAPSVDAHLVVLL